MLHAISQRFGGPSEAPTIRKPEREHRLAPFTFFHTWGSGARAACSSKPAWEVLVLLLVLREQHCPIIHALALLDEMRAEKVLPDSVTFNSAIAACKSAGRREAAAAVEAGRDAHGGGAWPDSLTFNAALRTGARTVDARM